MLLILGVSATGAQSALFPVPLGDHIGIVDRAGGLVAPAEFREAGTFSEGLVAVKVDRKWGYLDGGGVLVIPATYDSAGDFADGLAGVCADYFRCGFIDRTGAWVVKPEFWVVGQFSEGLAAARNGDGLGYVDRTGGWVVRPRPVVSRAEGGGCISEPTSLSLDSMLHGGVQLRQFGGVNRMTSSRFSQGRASITLDGETWGVIDRRGEWIVKPGYPWIGRFSDGLAPFYENDKIGFIGLDGQIAIPAQFDDTQGFTEGMAAVLKNERWGFVDTKGRYAIRPRFDGADSFSGGLAPVEIDGQWGYIARTGEFFLHPTSEYLFLGRLVNGLAKVFLDDGNDGFNVGLIDAGGRVVWREIP
jgi:hypothetical protein